MRKTKTGVILANLGTPSAPTAKAVSAYLWEFLSDPRIVDLPRWQWLPLLKGVIIPRRAKPVAHLYSKIWTKEGSPLLAMSYRQRDRLQQYFNQQQLPVYVETAMTYGNPSMENALNALEKKQVEKMILLPLYPQYSSTTTGAVLDCFARALQKRRHIVPFDVIHSYHTHPLYLDSLANRIKVRYKSDEFLLFSFHGIPLRYEKEGDDYRLFCEQTVQHVVDRLNIPSEQWAITFQSRFGREAWLQPYTDDFLKHLVDRRQFKKVAIICPGFSVDCLETLEEINQENRRIFLENGGKTFQYIPALNADRPHIEMMADLISPHL